MSVAAWVTAVALAAPAAPPEPQRPASMDAPPPAATPEPQPEPTPAPAPAAKPASGVDEVVLKNGGFVRGEVVELLPNDHVVIIPEGTTDRRTIAWSDVERVDRGK